MKNIYGKKTPPPPAPPTYIPPEKKKSFTWFFVVLICAGIWSLSLFFPGNAETFLIGLAVFLVSVFFLYHTYMTGSIRPTFRAGCYIWLLFFAGIGMMIAGIGEIIHPS